ncbi:glycine zipper 2TM domain-containing protein [Amaricoccus sp.]|uniref:glycine zipper 2TM domain-containing protein n=1 Tax=Amaricoccus sp. TaxID=1872485 RepID=UPI001B735E86|nr:glycine zipper 2TM domain-containing protein [Amaricoccus sp.]MBP7241372.1 glycine zipper 2TM domain-containing protein [Amaricoccus sp.]
MTLSRPVRATALALAATALLACNPPNSGTTVDASQAQRAQTVAFGTIIAAQPVTVQGGNTPAAVVGTIGGGLAGGLLGNEIGGGRGRDIATVVGATAGAAAGNRVANAATTQQSVQWTVELESGRTIAVIQAEPRFSIGQRVQVVQSGGTTRLLP